MKIKLRKLQSLVDLANTGDTPSQYQLGLTYDLGIGVPKDWTLSFDYYTQAAKGNHAKAQYNLAICYALGKGIDKDLIQSKHWINQARKNGYSGGSGF